MAVAPTGAMYKSLFFDGEDSRDYGVYITGEAVFNAPEREVEMVSIPGRNGQLALDKGRFENIEVTYPAGIFADNEEDFAEAISNFRNLLCSRRGYVRLQDEYHPNEYRMAIYKSGLEVSPAQLRAGEFDIVFDCKPQRWLTSGEEAITVDSGDVVSNPTLFEASPLLEVDGYGTININDKEIELTNDVFGHVVLASNQSFPITMDAGYYDLGDTITLTKAYPVSIILEVDNNYSSASAFNGIESVTHNGSKLYVSTSEIDGGTFTAGTSSTFYKNISFTYETIESGVTKRATAVLQLQFRYVASTETVSINVTVSLTPISGYTAPTFIPLKRGISGSAREIYVESTATILGNPTYIDCDIGEAYKIVNAIPISLNGCIDLGSDLPTLPSGNTTITYDNTITDFKVVPRWWKV